MRLLRCAHCGRVVPANPRIKNQTHCDLEACRRDKRRLWQRQKMASDPDYKANQRECHKTCVVTDQLWTQGAVKVGPTGSLVSLAPGADY